MIIVSRLSHSDSDFSTFSICSSLGGLPNRPRLNRNVLQTVSNVSVGNSCGTSPILARVSRNSVTMSWPSTSTSPPLGLTMPQTILISVVLPAPFGPKQAEDLAPVDLEINILECLEPTGVGLGQAFDRNH